MTRSVDLRDRRTLAEAEAVVAALIDEAQQTALEDFEIAMADLGTTDRNDIDRQLARRRAELETVREELLAGSAHSLSAAEKSYSELALWPPATSLASQLSLAQRHRERN